MAISQGNNVFFTANKLYNVVPRNVLTPVAVRYQRLAWSWGLNSAAVYNFAIYHQGQWPWKVCQQSGEFVPEGRLVQQDDGRLVYDRYALRLPRGMRWPR